MDFKIYKPQDALADHVQGIWSVVVPADTPTAVSKQLLSDAGSGVVFILSAEVAIAEHSYSPGVILLPISTQSHSVSMPAGTIMAGVRFHPAVGYHLFGQRFEKAQPMATSCALYPQAQALWLRLQKTTRHQQRIELLKQWVSNLIEASAPLPQMITPTLIPPTRNAESTETDRLAKTKSQRQIERQFQKWLGITPKHYQRILRVKQTLEALKAAPDTPLAELAIEHGFADQAHMTRECRSIARTTPKQFARLRNQ